MALEIFEIFASTENAQLLDGLVDYVIVYVRPVRRIGNEIRSGPDRSAVSDRSRTDLGPDRFDDFFRRRENCDDAKIFEKKSTERRDRFHPRIVKIGAILRIF